MIKDGVEPGQIVACDLLPELLELGFELFGDSKDSPYLQGLTLEKVDIFNQSDTDKITTPNGYHAIYVGSFIHLFPLAWQQKTLAALEKLLSKERGSVIWGRQVGMEEGKAGARQRITKGSRGPTGIEENIDGTKDSPYFHDINTLKKLFNDAHPAGWQSEVVLYDWKMEMGPKATDADGAQMIDTDLIKLMKRLSFAFFRK